MDNLTIAQLSQFSGIKAHTIRIWEQRYNAFTPERSEGNVRYYSSLQLRRLLNIVSLLEADYKISKICKINKSDYNLFRYKQKSISFKLQALLFTFKHHDRSIPTRRPTNTDSSN